MMNKTIDYYMNLPYTIELTPEPEGSWFVAVKELPGCMSQGDSPEEAIEMIRDAMRGWIEASLQDGDIIPEPQSLEEFSGKFVVRVPRSLHRDLVESAEREGVSLNQYINVVLSRGVGRVVTRTRSAEEERSWPGLKSAVQQVLQAAGFGRDAGEIDERLLANWADQCLGQIESALSNGDTRDAFSYLQYMRHVLAAGLAVSPILAAFNRLLLLLENQVQAFGDLQKGVIDELLLRSRIAQTVQGVNLSLAQSFIQDERIAYSASSTRKPEEEYVGVAAPQPRAIDW